MEVFGTVIEIQGDRVNVGYTIGLTAYANWLKGSDVAEGVWGRLRAGKHVLIVIENREGVPVAVAIKSMR